MVKSLLRLSYFYFEESCGQCTPCREGTGWIADIMKRMTEGNAKSFEIDQLEELSKQIEGQTICALGDAAAMPVRGFLKHYRDEFAFHIENKRCVVAPYI
jgi:NADH-quinone oxidoreductase subunit F